MPTSIFYSCLTDKGISYQYFWDAVSLCSPIWTRTCYVDQDGPKLRESHTSTSKVLGLKACATLPCKIYLFLFFMCMIVLLACMYVPGIWHMLVCSIPCLAGTHEGQKSPDLLELELWTTVSHYAGAKNQAQVLYKSNKWSNHWSTFPAWVSNF